ncbi:hypothetical protein [Streptomyces triticisoli]|uniref:hypothetical protein n=1 Tax=Streptomyces triticisoli TaxID=2182797 RepID=UPI002FCD6E99
MPIEEYNALEEAADELLARKALQTLEGEVGAPSTGLAQVGADMTWADASPSTCAP